MNHKYFSLIIPFLTALLLGGCSTGNDNWVIIEDLQPGVYITGEATAYATAAPAAQLQTLTDLDPADTEVPSNIVSMMTWLRGGKPFTITIAETKENVTEYGQGNEIGKQGATTLYELGDAAKPFTVSADGLYRIFVDKDTKQLHLLPVSWGVIGAATAGGWDKETPLSDISFNEKDLTVSYSAEIPLTAGEFKLRYSGDWGYTIREGIKVHTNAGGTASGTTLPTSGGFIASKPGGDNFSNAAASEYLVTALYSLRDRKVQISAKLTGKAPLPPEPGEEIALPEAMYLIGNQSDWNWDNALELVPVNGYLGPKGKDGETRFWTIHYFAEGDQFKGNSLRSWNGNEFGFAAVDQATVDAGIVKDEGGNIFVLKAGWYLVTISTTAKDGKLSSTVQLLSPDVYLVGPAAGDTWSTPNDYKFTIPTTPDGVFTSPAAVKDGDLRIALALSGVEWWQGEFIVRDGKISYRGNGGDQEPRVPVKAGQVVTLDFGTGTGQLK